MTWPNDDEQFQTPINGFGTGYNDPRAFNDSLSFNMPAFDPLSPEGRARDAALGPIDFSGATTPALAPQPSAPGMDFSRLTQPFDDALSTNSRLAEGLNSQRQGLLTQYDAADKISEGTWGGMIGQVLAPLITGFALGKPQLSGVGVAGNMQSYFNNLAEDEKSKKLDLANRIKFTESLIGDSVAEQKALELAKLSGLTSANENYMTGRYPGTEPFAQAKEAERQLYQDKVNYEYGKKLDYERAKDAEGLGSTNGLDMPGDAGLAAKLGLPEGATNRQIQQELRLRGINNTQDRFNTGREDKIASANLSGLFTQVGPDGKPLPTDKQTPLNANQQKALNGVANSLPPMLKIMDQLDKSVSEHGTQSVGQPMEDQKRYVAGIIQQMRQFYNQSSRQTQQQMALDSNELGVKILDGTFNGTIENISQNLRGIDQAKLIKDAKELVAQTAAGIAGNANMAFDLNKVTNSLGLKQYEKVLRRTLDDAGIDYLGKTAPTAATPTISPNVQAVLDYMRMKQAQGGQ